MSEQNTNEQEQIIAYLISGQGADHRLFDKIELGHRYEIRHIDYITPKENTSLKEYAIQLSDQIDQNRKFILIGVSLGGMLAVEMSQLLNPEKVIIISSAKSRNELPFMYRIQRKVPIYKILSPAISKKGALIVQPIVEPDTKKERETFESMLKDKDPLFLIRTIEMILNWEREEEPEGIVHIHGDSDNTIPIRNVSYDYRIENGSHMMTLTKGIEISELVNKILEQPVITPAAG